MDGKDSLVTSNISHLVIGRVANPRGVRGELRVDIETEDPERFYHLRKVFLGEQLAPFEVQKARLHEGQALLQLKGIEDREAAEQWHGALVYVALADAIPLEENEYFHYQIRGLQVITVDGEVLGRVTDIITTGANDVYVVQGDQGEILLPAIADVIVEVNLEAGTLRVQLLEGLR
jgi:16S rRNA processing protein RimM